jgi:hypothetical protein
MAYPFITTILAAFFSVVAALTSVTANAVPITYTESAIVSGTLGGAPFNNALIEITGIGDTGNIIGAHGSAQNLLSSLSFNLSGTGAGTFRPSPDRFLAISNIESPLFVGSAGFADDRPFGAFLLLETRNPLFGTYGLDGPIGPISGPSAFSASAPFPTTAGDLVINASGDATFAAVLGAAVPEPGSVSLLATAVIGFGILRRRRKGTKGGRRNLGL